MKRLSISSTLLGLLVLLVVAGCSSPTPPPKPTPTAAPSGKRVTGGASVIAAGKVMPVKSAALSMSGSGIVAQILVKEGDRVDANQVILRLAAGQQNAAVAQAQAKLAQAIANRDGAKRALDSSMATRDNPQELDTRIAQTQGQVNTAKYQVDAARANATSAETQKDAAGGVGISPQQKVLMNQWYAAQSQLAAAQATYDGAQSALQVLLDMRAHPIALDAQVDAAKAESDSAAAAVNVAQADLDHAKAALADTELRAPFAGTIANLSTNPGELVTPTAPVAYLADFSKWQIETTDLTELSIVNIHEGDAATLSFDAIPDLELSGKVTAINLLGVSRQGDVNYDVIVTPDQADPRLRWNMTAKVAIVTK